jgi:hypothetical protein
MVATVRRKSCLCQLDVPDTDCNRFVSLSQFDNSPPRFDGKTSASAAPPPASASTAWRGSGMLRARPFFARAAGMVQTSPLISFAGMAPQSDSTPVTPLT